MPRAEREEGNLVRRCSLRPPSRSSTSSSPLVSFLAVVHQHQHQHFVTRHLCRNSAVVVTLFSSFFSAFRFDWSETGNDRFRCVQSDSNRQNLVFRHDPNSNYSDLNQRPRRRITKVAPLVSTTAMIMTKKAMMSLMEYGADAYPEGQR